ncbi:MAG: DUF2797 domain-containing protein [Bacteroidales bacterium]|nr:DUF2797 domain-containing protein [Bacteroidales bacterium]
MRTELPETGKEALYYLPLDEQEIDLNDFIGHNIRITFRHEIHCIHCGRLIKKTYAQGYCYPCFISLPETDVCILRPELCQAHLGISRDMAWSKEHCLQDHFVYLALTSGLKVGVTRKTQVSTRWIDQGADQAIRIAKTPNRHLAGEIEVILKKYMNDKTNWRQMLKGSNPGNHNLVAEMEKALALLPESYRQYFFEEDQITHIRYPVLSWPEKIKTVSLDKQDRIEARLTGIKGQYLLFEDGEVLNIRKHGGYVITLSTL